jgi:sigma-B regulation protein RsbU (phosphoserine phosphatase)
MEKMTFANRLSLRIMAVLIVISAIIMAVVYLITKDSMARESEARYESIILHTNEKIRGVLSDVYVGAINNVNVIERDLNDPDMLQKHLERMVTMNKYMSSCRLIFEPDFFPQKGHNFEIYAWRDSTGVVRGRQMTERHHDFLVHTWYKKAFENAEDDWTPPYFDRAASQQLTTTYLIHIYDSHGSKVGMLGADVSLEWLRLRHEQEDAAIHKRYEEGFKEHSYSFIIDHDGTYLIHPNEAKVLKMKIQDVVDKSPNTLDDVMVKRMLNKESGSCRISYDGLNCWVFYSYVKYADWTVVIVVPEEIINHKGNLLANIILSVFFVGLIVIYLLSSHLIKKNMRPLSRFVAAAGQVAQGNFDMELPEVKSREVDALRDAFKDMQGSLANYVEELKDQTATNVAMEQELRIASDIQQRMLPKVYPPFPERTDIDIFGEVVTAKKVGGDLFDFFIHDEKLYFSIGDVAGKGVPAALVMAVARSMFRSASMTHISPKLIVESINRSVCQSNDSFMFVTLFMGVLDLATGRLLYTNAGHEPPVLVGGAHTRFLNVNNNIPLGLRPDWEYTEQKSIIDRDTTLFLYTDGYTEAETVEREQFGKQRMCDEALRLSAENLNSRTFVQKIRKAERVFVNYIPQGDDISLLAIKYKGSMSNPLYHRGISLLNDVKEVPALAIFVGSICQDMCFNELTEQGIRLAVEEAVVNIMNYAYPKGTRAVILIEADVDADNETLTFVLRDEGVAFDPTAYQEVDVNDHVGQQKVGGLGIHLMRHYMDTLAYERKDGQNVLTMTKKIKGNQIKDTI